MHSSHRLALCLLCALFPLTACQPEGQPSATTSPATPLPAPAPSTPPTSADRVAKNSVVTIDYSLTDPSGKTLDSTAGKTPLTYFHARGNLIPGLERQLEGKTPGQSFKTTIAPADAYGIRDEKLVQVVPKSSFPRDTNFKIDAQFKSQDGKVVRIVKIDADNITIDGNHPLAGIPLTFDVTIKSIRTATPQELADGFITAAR